MRILAVGNSFSQDATRYLHQIARADGVRLDVANLYIGGCSLERHHRNMLSDERAYELQYNGQLTGFFVSLKEALLNRAWDIVTLQQASHYSFKKDSYDPYTKNLAAFVRTCVPKAKILIHQTWAYEDGSDRLYRVAGYEQADKMFADLRDAYDIMCATAGAEGIIPAGEMFMALLGKGVEKVHRDTFHASLGTGRYALALLWYRMICGKRVAENQFSDFDEPISEDELCIVKEYIDGLEPILNAREK